MMEDVERASGPHRMRLSLSAVMLQWAEGMKVESRWSYVGKHIAEHLAQMERARGPTHSMMGTLRVQGRYCAHCAHS
jgi:hypothetical protein